MTDSTPPSLSDELIARMPKFEMDSDGKLVVTFKQMPYAGAHRHPDYMNRPYEEIFPFKFMPRGWRITNQDGVDILIVSNGNGRRIFPMAMVLNIQVVNNSKMYVDAYREYLNEYRLWRRDVREYTRTPEEAELPPHILAERPPMMNIDLHTGERMIDGEYPPFPPRRR